MNSHLRDRTWFSKDKTEIHPFDIQIYLVIAPLTFGHSQLIARFPSNGDYNESKRFQLAAPFIEIALETFQQAFGKTGIHKNTELESLAKLTKTYGNYLKTLILKTSANESKSEYKVHLVPYFASHASACKRRFAAIHSVDPKKTGGLLGWLGTRETIADGWLIESDNPFKERLDDIAEGVLGLTHLNRLLSKEISSQA